MGVSKNRGENPKIDGEIMEKPLWKMDDLGGKPTIFGSTSKSPYHGIYPTHGDFHVKKNPERRGAN